MLKFEKERIIFFHIYYTLISLESFMTLTYYLLTNIKPICLKLKKIFQKFARKIFFRTFAAEIGNLIDK